MKKLALETQLQVSIIREGKKFIAYAPALDLSTSGNNYEEVKNRFNEIVHIFFEEIFKRGTLEDVLIDLGWKRLRKGWNPPIIVSQESEKVKIPMK